MTLSVMERKCANCLFTRDKIVSDERRRDVLAECKRTETHFVCHLATMEGRDDVICRGFYDMDPNATQAMQVFGRLGMLRFITLEDEALIPHRLIGDRHER